ncbi:MAG: hypothetical protein ACLUFV_12980 [Acutalibacteraceae bacterium]
MSMTPPVRRRLADNYRVIDVSPVPPYGRAFVDLTSVNGELRASAGGSSCWSARAGSGAISCKTASDNTAIGTVVLEGASFFNEVSEGRAGRRLTQEKRG